ncbi:peptide chain release factor 2 [Buchnera aphidicola]|uniref:Peptide chain release factor 2 n=1 Tax=Buchnera aphidicola (Therioaphis trifolii) TaxID=1241884 RepID=A0A4D6YGD0_9GAMM|nr:peptide chain release factor 2 [Buchnera aphidicola]QCI27273.1 peptide chain release factor 2 [Buchnera aphidicola (Therioaphis trifolii)]
MIINIYNEKINKIIKKIKKIKNKINLQHKKYYNKKNFLKNNINNNINIQKNKKKIFKIKKIIEKINIIKNKIYEIQELLKLSIIENDHSILNDIKIELKNIKKNIKKIINNNHFKKKYDNCNCYIDIQSGSGGIDAQDWSKMLLRMYLKWLEKKGFKTIIIQKLSGEIAGIKSATVHVIGKYAFGWLRTETGIHRLIRKSPFDSGHRRHTSFSSAFVYPEIDNAIKIKINPSDLRIDVYRSSGAGGQHVNRTESAVRITHLPTSTVTQCQNERSQHKNKEHALKQMKYKLYNLELKKKNQEKKNIENNKSSIRWGNQIRSYILDHSRIKDIRTGIETRDIQSVLNGNLDIFVESSLKIGL